MEGNIAYILLSTQVALNTHISPFLRAVTVDFIKKESLLILRFFYDCAVTDELYDLASCASVEIDPDEFPYTIEDEITFQCEYPNKIPIQGRLVFLRNEEIPTIYKQESAVHFAGEALPFIAKVLLAMQDALLGRVSHQLRWVSVEDDVELRNIWFYFFYDGEISEKNYILASTVVQETLDCFPGFRGCIDIRRIDFPEKLQPLGKRLAYARCEDSFRNIQW